MKKRIWIDIHYVMLPDTKNYWWRIRARSATKKVIAEHKGTGDLDSPSEHDFNTLTDRDLYYVTQKEALAAAGRIMRYAWKQYNLPSETFIHYKHNRNKIQDRKTFPRSSDPKGRG